MIAYFSVALTFVSLLVNQTFEKKTISDMIIIRIKTKPELEL